MVLLISFRLSWKDTRKGTVRATQYKLRCLAVRLFYAHLDIMLAVVMIPIQFYSFLLTL